MNSEDVCSILKDHFTPLPISVDVEEANRVVVHHKHIWSDAI